MQCLQQPTGRIRRVFASAVLIVTLGALVWITMYAASVRVPKALSKYREMCAPVSLPKEVPAEGGLTSTAPKQIWFIESSGRNGTCLNERQACAIESAAVHNPDLPVNLVLTGSQSQSCLTLAVLNSSLPTFHIALLDVEDEFKGAPLDPWYKKGTWKTAKNKMEDLSDTLRWLVLWKRGGIYLDLDVIVLQPLDEYDNVAGMEDSVYPGTAVLAFQKEHPFLTTLQESCVREYNTARWGSCGPTLLRNVYNRWTGAKPLCMLPNISFYPVHYNHWEKLFDSDSTKEVLQTVEGSLAVHLWNKLSGSLAMRVGSGCAYDVLARSNCPQVYRLMASKGVV